MSEKFSLKWNNFSSNVLKTFASLRNEDDFSDVTLVSDDQKQYSAHKVVLSSCSEYFHKILKQNNHPNPLLCLEGINSDEMKHSLDYAYHGEVDVYQEDLSRFLSIAERLKLEGLVAEEENNAKPHSDTKDVLNKIEAEDIVDSDHKVTSSPTKDAVVKIQDFGNFQSIAELDAKILEHIEKESNTKRWICNICEKICKDKSAAKLHVEIHFDGLRFPCNVCDTILSTRSSLERHMFRKHK